jgi:membrane-associated phospholipid phosphatase
MLSSRAITALSGAALAGGIGVAVARQSTGPVNRAVRRRIHPGRSPAVKSLAKGVSFLAGPYSHPFVAGGLGTLMRLQRGTGGAGPVAASLGTLVFDNLARIFVHQRRPPKAGSHVGRNRYAFPSGHVTAATAIAVATAGEVADQLSPAQRRLLWTSVAALSVAIGWSRLYLDEHWMDDVAGGLMAGVAIGLGAATVSAYTP